jgi:hypothetical protein
MHHSDPCLLVKEKNQRFFDSNLPDMKEIIAAREHRRRPFRARGISCAKGPLIPAGSGENTQKRRQA